MKKIVPVWFVFMLLSAHVGLFAQDLPISADEKYGLDPLLYNGKYYTYFFPSGTLGSPFFSGTEYVNGSIHLHGLHYDDLSLNFDLINQQLVLQYMLDDGGIKRIILSDAWLEAFNLGNAQFEIKMAEDSIKHIYQVIGSEPIRVYYSWFKELKLDSRPGAHNYIFTPAMKRTYLFSENRMVKYFSNKSFVSLLNIGMQSRVKKYLSQKKINVKKASDGVMAEFVSYLNTPLHK